MKLLYGTAWKENETQRLVSLALEAGFRGIDTANQRKHYFEAAVGEAVQRSGLKRAELFLQTKFTFRGGQDSRLPYDPQAPIALQVEQSFASSLEHLGVDTIDSYVLHGPSGRGWAEDDAEAWAAMESLHESGKAKALGISNVSRAQLKSVLKGARIKPKYVQNRCYARMGWDAEVRALCREHGMTYQGFSLLTANPQVLEDVRGIAAKHEVTAAQVVFAFALAIGMLPLTGTTSREHMQQDLEAAKLQLLPHELRQLEHGPLVS